MQQLFFRLPRHDRILQLVHGQCPFGHHEGQLPKQRLLRTWKQETWLKQVNDEWAKDKEQREKREDGIQQSFPRRKKKPRRAGTLTARVKRW
jgi:hypothetical protein